MTNWASFHKSTMFYLILYIDTDWLRKTAFAGFSRSIEQQSSSIAPLWSACRVAEI